MEELDLTACDLESVGAEALSTAIHVGSLGMLRVLRLGKNQMELRLEKKQMEPRGLTLLAKALATGACPRLEVLDVDDNKGEVSAMNLLIGAVCKGVCLKLWSLTLGHNVMGDVGLARLASGMVGGKLPHLRVLGLAEAGVSTEGIRSLARALNLGVGRSSSLWTWQITTSTHKELKPWPSA